MKNKIISLAITLIIIIQFLLPIVSRATSTIKITAVQDTTNLHNVTVTIDDDLANITEFKYVNKNIQLDDIDYFNTGSDVVSVDITESKNISKVLTLEYGEYTFYAKDAKNNEKIYRKTIKPNETPNITISKDGLNLKIIATGTEAKISKIKIGKRTDNNTAIDFSSNGTELSITPGLSVETTYTATEKGVYDVYAENEYGASMRYNKITLLPEDEEELEVSCTNVGKKLTITAKDALANIIKVKIALASDASSKADFLTKGTDIPITAAQTITKEYEVNESGTYNIYIEDELGNTFIYTKTVTDDEINFLVANLESGKYKITATSSEGNITKLQVAYSKNENESKDNLDWKDISITSGSSVTAIITKETDSDIYAYIYSESDKSKNKIISFLINANSADNDTTAPIITLTQDEDDLTKINVNVKDETNNLSSVKYAFGEQEVSYFASNGNEISVPDSTKEISSSFAISDIGTYTVYAKDSKGNETTETITITKIDEEDTTGPTITTTKEKINNSTIRIKITATDDSSSIKVIKIAPNEQDISYFSNNGTTLDQTIDEKSAIAYVDVKSNGTYTIYTEDSKGNTSISNITITEIGTSDDENNTAKENDNNNNNNSSNSANNNNTSNSSNTNNVNNISNSANNNNTSNSNNTNNVNNISNTINSKNNNNSSSTTRNDGTGKTKVQTISADDTSSSSSKTELLPYTGGVKNILLVLIAFISIFGIVEYRKYRNLK